MEEVLEQFNHHHARTDPGCEAREYVHCLGQPNGEESYIVLESEPTHSLVANLLQDLSLAVRVNLVLQAKSTVNEATDRCVQTFDSGCYGISEAHQNNHSYVLELSVPTFRFTTHEFSMVGGYTEELKNHKTVKLGSGRLLRTVQQMYALGIQ